MERVEKIGIQPLVFSSYEINGHFSDSEGQLIPYDLEQYEYKFLNDNLSDYKNVSVIQPHEIYISPSMKSTFNVELGQIIEFPISRDIPNKQFVIAGFYEDPFMGSSMIDMKGFLINRESYEEIVNISINSGIESLAFPGFMIHIWEQKNNEQTSNTNFNSYINANTSIANYTDFSYSFHTINGFMLLLQNVLSGLLIAFSLVLAFISFIVLNHSINNTIEHEYVNFGILKSIGVTNRKIQLVQVSFYAISILSGLIVGIICSSYLLQVIISLTITTTGLIIPHTVAYGTCGIIFSIIIFIFVFFIFIKINGISKISVLNAIKFNFINSNKTKYEQNRIHRKYLAFSLTLRKLFTSTIQYISILCISILLMFFSVMINRVTVWLGPNGEGMMDAFNPADHHIGVQIMGNSSISEVEEIINQYTTITDTYLLAMPTLSINGINYTGNIISEPERFRILQGNSCLLENEIVVTEFFANNNNLKIGDEVEISYRNRKDTYIISGLYQCANSMGNNIGMSQEGFNKISTYDPNIWCYHYFIDNTELQSSIIDSLNYELGTSVDR